MTPVASSRRATLGFVALGALPALGLVVVPHSPITAVVLGVIAMFGTLHGLGRIVGRLAGDDHAPVALALAWGLAAWIAVAGPLLAIGAFVPATRIVIASIGCVAGAAWCAIALPGLITARDRSSMRTGAWFASMLVLGLVVLYVLGAAGHVDAPFVDAETGALDQLRRLDDTGGLADALGFPRTIGLGGNLTATSLVTLAGDPRFAHMIDRGVAFAIAMGLVLGLAKARRGGQLAALTIPLVASAVPELVADLAPMWTVVALVLATWATLARAEEAGSRERERLVLVAVGLAASIATVRHAGFAFALVIAIGVGRTWPMRQATARTFAVMLAIVGPYLASALAAWHAGPSDPILVGLGAPSVAAALGLVAGGGIVVLLVVAATRSPRATTLRIVLIASAVAVAASGFVSVLGTLESALPFVVAMVFAITLASLAPPVDVDELEPSERTGLGLATAVIAIALVCGVLTMARYQIVTPLEAEVWQYRLAELLGSARSLARVPPTATTSIARDHAAAFATIPSEARIGTWTDRGDLVPHDRLSIVDLRTGPVRRCIATKPDSIAKRCGPLVARAGRLGLTHLVVETSSAPPVVVEALTALGTPRGGFGDVQIIELSGTRL